jgi:hypothetical protein
MNAVAPAEAHAYLGRTTPIYAIGDSHVLIYNGLVFQSKALGTSFVVDSTHIQGIAAKHFVDDAGKLNPRVFQALRDEGLISDPEGNANETPDDIRAFHRISNHYANYFRQVGELTAGEPLIMLFIGDIDLRMSLIKQLAQADFVLPGFDAAMLPSTNAKQIIPFPLVKDLALSHLTPLFAGLRLLRDAGFAALYLHCVVPPTPDDDWFEGGHHFRAPVALRAKCAVLMNDLMRDLCRENGIGFIDVWPAVARGVVAAQEYALDSIHLNRAAAVLSVQALLQSVAERSAALT